IRPSTHIRHRLTSCLSAVPPLPRSTLFPYTTLFRSVCTKPEASLTAAVLLLAAALGHAQTRWVGSWAASQQRPEPYNSLATDDLRDATLRQVVHLTIGGAEVRIHLSNRFGTSPLHFTCVH